MWYKHFIKQKHFLVCDLDLKVNDGARCLGMVQRKSLDQYLTPGKVSTRFIKGSGDFHF